MLNDSSPSHNAASCQPRSQCPLRTKGTREVGFMLKQASPTPPSNAAPSRKRLNGPGSSGDDDV